MYGVWAEGLMADEREVEAVGAALTEHLSGSGDWSKAAPAMAKCAIAALDRVRDARGDDEAAPQGECSQCGRAWPSSRFECPCGAAISYRNPARSPQDEDHEAGIEWAEERALRAIADTSRWDVPTEDRDEDAHAAIAAMKSEGVVLSRVSPVSGTEPDGPCDAYPNCGGSCVSGTEPDTAKLQAAIDKAHAAMNSSQYVGGPSQRDAWRTAFGALSEVVTQHKGQAKPARARSAEYSVDAGNQEA